ncbi:MAG: hypothetical protein WCO26_26165, partial [Deltaproteobacteria bacterium]
TSCKFSRKSILPGSTLLPRNGIEKSSFFEDIDSRGLEQMIEIFGKLYLQAAKHLPKGYAERPLHNGRFQ